MKKILFLILIIVILYILIIFNYPILAKNIGKITGLTNFNENVLKFKDVYDKTVTNLPTDEELKDTYDKTIEGVNEVKGVIEVGVEITKDTIDTIRDTFSGAEDNIKDINETYDKVTDFVDNASDTIDAAKEVIDDIKEKSSTGLIE